MTQTGALDISHLTFLDLIRAVIAQSGPSPAKGTLIRMAFRVAENIPPAEYDSMEDFIAAAGAGDTPIARIEGPATYLGGGVFGLPRCPFTDLITNYKTVFETLPGGYDELMEAYNATSPITDKYRVGEGAGVSPFCLMHQPMRSALGDRITIGGTPIKVYQLGCKSGAGVKAVAQKWAEETGHGAATVDGALDGHMCCYSVEMEG